MDLSVTIGADGTGWAQVSAAPDTVTITAQPSAGTASTTPVEGQPELTCVTVVNAPPNTRAIVGLSIAEVTPGSEAAAEPDPAEATAATDGEQIAPSAQSQGVEPTQEVHDEAAQIEPADAQVGDAVTVTEGEGKPDVVTGEIKTPGQTGPDGEALTAPTADEFAAAAAEHQPAVVQDATEGDLTLCAAEVEAALKFIGPGPFEFGAPTPAFEAEKAEYDGLLARLESAAGKTRSEAQGVSPGELIDVCLKATPEFVEQATREVVGPLSMQLVDLAGGGHEIVLYEHNEPVSAEASASASAGEPPVPCLRDAIESCKSVLGVERVVGIDKQEVEKATQHLALTLGRFEGGLEDRPAS